MKLINEYLLSKNSPKLPKDDDYFDIVVKKLKKQYITKSKGVIGKLCLPKIGVNANYISKDPYEKYSIVYSLAPLRFYDDKINIGVQDKNKKHGSYNYIIFNEDIDKKKFYEFFSQEDIEKIINALSKNEVHS